MKIFKTLTNTLIAWIIMTLLIIWLVIIVVSFATGNHEADELTDGRLASIGSLILALDLTTKKELGELDINSHLMQNLEAHDYQLSLSIILWQNNNMLLKIGNSPIPVLELSNGFHDLTLNDHNLWRIFVAQNKGQKVAVLLNINERDNLADDIAMQIIMPLICFLPIIALVLTLAVKRGIKPLQQLSTQIDSLDIKQPITSSTWQITPYDELQNITFAIENLSKRYQQALVLEQEIADNFAHELRTPLTSLKLNVELLGKLTPNLAGQQIVQQVQQSAIIASNAINDLLDLARSKRINLTANMQQLDLTLLSQNLLAKYAPLFIKKEHHIKFNAPQNITIVGHANLLTIALRNLLDNALVHNPAQSTTVFTITDNKVQIELTTYAKCEVKNLNLLHDEDGIKSSGINNLNLSNNLGIGHKLISQIAQIHNAKFISETKHLTDQTINSFKLVFTN